MPQKLRHSRQIFNQTGDSVVRGRKGVRCPVSNRFLKIFSNVFQNVTVLVTVACYTPYCEMDDCEFWSGVLQRHTRSSTRK